MAYLDDVYAVVQIQPTGVETFVRLSQNENGRQMYFAIQGGELPSGSTATISGTKPDGVVYSASATISGNTVTVNEDIQLTAVAGAWPAKLRILNGGQVIATGRIRFVIDADPVAPGSVPSDSELEGLVAEAAEYAEAAKNAAYYGSPLVASTVAGMTDHTRVYVYTGSESGYINGNWYYWNGSAWTSGGVYNAQGISTDPTLTIAGKAADAKATGDRLTAAEGDLADVKSDLTNLFTNGAKQALLDCLNHMAWLTDEAPDYISALETALFPEEYPKIIATFTPGTHVVYNVDSLSSLIPYLTVKYYEDESSAGTIVSTYTLSGTLSNSISYITATYEGLTDTFAVTVVDIDNIGEWLYPSDITNYVLGSTQKISNDDTRCVINSPSPRWIIGNTIGPIKIKYKTTLVDSIIAPIKIPDGYTGATVTFTHSDSVSDVKYAFTRLKLEDGYYKIITWTSAANSGDRTAFTSSDQYLLLTIYSVGGSDITLTGADIVFDNNANS